MSVIATALHTAHAAIINLGPLLAEEADVQFDETKVTPGPAGFIATAVVAIAVLLLGFLLVRRIRRISFRAEARESIAAELAAEGAAAEPAADASAAPMTPAADADDAPESGDPANPTQP